MESLQNLTQRLQQTAQEPSGLRIYRARLKKALAGLREQYKEAHACKELTGWQQWLIDNSYSLEAHAKQTLNDLGGFRQDAQAAGQLLRQLEAVFGDGEIEVNEENLREALLEIDRIHELGERQLDFLLPALRTVLVLRAASEANDDQARETQLSGAVTALEQLAQIDFDTLVRQISAVEKLLLGDPAGVYPRMAEVSRRHYRHIAARIGRLCGVAETQVARDVLDCAREARSEGQRHVGFFLMGHDPQTASARRRGLLAAVGGVLLTIGAAALLAYRLHSVAAGILLLFPLAELVRQAVFPLLLRGVAPAHLPRLTLEPAQLPCIAVAVATLLPAASDAGKLKGRLEQLYFSNKADNLMFCVLADHKEERKPFNPRDEAALQAASEAVRALNAQYGERFVLFVRRRVWCKTQDSYAGWERKRGAIEEFIRFAKGGEAATACFVGDRERLAGIEYLLTLDSDTGLGFDAANRLAAVAMHPLNRPIINKKGRVVSGYGILTTRMTSTLLDKNQTWFSHLMAGENGISSYEQACGEWNQDILGETCFVGKGLIDVDAFQKTLARHFPENVLLSHDIMEGAYLRTGLVSELEMSETTPANASAWYSRLHRWTRGDWQNLRFLGNSFRAGAVHRENPIGWISRLFLIKNLWRSLTSVVPVVALLLLSFGVFGGGKTIVFCNILILLSVCFAPLKDALQALISSPRTAIFRRFFCGGMPRFWELLVRTGATLIMAGQRAVVCADAMVRSLWRIIVSKRNLLQWTTAAQAGEERESLSGLIARGWPALVAGAGLVVMARDGVGRMFGLLLLLYPLFALMTARVSTAHYNLPTRAQREQLLDWCARMLEYYETYANKKNHWLPPDNVQFSPVETVARRTSPTNIGMMLLSYLAARDMNLLDSVMLYSRLSRTLDTIDKLETWNGNLYNWYATDDLRVLPNKFVSSVDSGNYLCALVALKEGILEYSVEEPKLKLAADRIEQMLAQTDFAAFYNPVRGLFSIGIDEDERPSLSHYDFLMSEARTASYYAIATRQAPTRHWRAMGRSMSRCGAYIGPVSWTGTMFEYFMPHLLLPVYEGSLLGEALRYALHCQKWFAARAGVPWGISESGYFAVDDTLNYQYKAHGIQRLGVKQGLDADTVVSPYSTFLALPFDLEGGMQNLDRLAALGMEGQYGFYEAIDFTHRRAGKNGSGIVRSFMAHHIGMSMTACANVLYGNVMQKRFMRDSSMRAAREFLQEKRTKDAVVHEPMNSRKKSASRKGIKPLVQRYDNPQPQAPACTLLGGGGLTHLFTDTGVSFLRYSDTDLTRRTDDLLMHPQGIFAVAYCQGRALCATAAPFYEEGQEHSAVFEGDCVSYRAKSGELELVQRFSIERAYPVERCTVTLINQTDTKAMAELLFYCEPVISQADAYAAHPAFSKLFMMGGRDAASDTITFSRRNMDTSGGLFLTVGFEKPYEYAFSLQREVVTPYPEGMRSLARPDAITMEGGTATPDGCCALRLPVIIAAHGKQEITLLFSCAASKEESVGNLVDARRTKSNPSFSPLQNDAMSGRLGARLLPQLLFAARTSETRAAALADNTRGQDALWTLGISGERPIVLFDWGRRPDRELLDAYLRFWRLMRLLRLEFDFCVLGIPSGKLPHGVHTVDMGLTDPALVGALRAAACEVIGEPEGEEMPIEQRFAPALLTSLTPTEIPRVDDRFDVVGGAYVGERFYVERVTPLPFSHILANEQFGCLMQDASLGNSWWQNARECKLSPWRNDIATGNDGERMLVMLGERIYDLCGGARASFSPDDARYEGMLEDMYTSLTVRIDQVAAVKYLELTLENRSDQPIEIVCAYALEPVMGVSRQTAKYTQFEQNKGCLLMHNPYNTTFSCFTTVHVEGELPSYMTNRADFYAGRWAAQELMPNNDPIAGTLVRKKLPPRRREQIKFILAAAPTREAAIELAVNSAVKKTAEWVPKEPTRSIRITTPSEPLNRFINTFAPHQIRAGRLQGRTGFYQCSGAYGFRDQLQDAGAYLFLDPSLAREQILRCCAVQFRAGDVLHWWHPLPTQTKGVRTRFSDDLLWLPLTVCDYLDATGDDAFLRRKVAYCRGEALADGEQERYMSVEADGPEETVYMHCVRAIEHGFRLGAHDLALIGCGDWNDGFSKIGEEGKGESVWLSMFLIIVLERFSSVADRQGDSARAAQWRENARLLRVAIDTHAWDSKYYLRAFYDDGTPLGGRGADECRIDLLPQSFAALCDMPDRARVEGALTQVMTHLVDFKHGIVKLFSPPFDTTPHNPGYVKAYPTGIRENGGQYTHAAVWLAAALLKQGRTEEGWMVLDILNPTARCTDASLAREMKTEPYYIAADIYTHSGCYGHGGWSIYTGAAAWYYRTVMGRLLGLAISGNAIELHPAIPPSWNQFEVEITQGDTRICITCKRTGKACMTVDGCSAKKIPFDGKSHRVQLEL